jgi:hypothetical protein
MDSGLQAKCMMGKSPPNTACTRRVGVATFSGTSRGYQVGSGKIALSHPAHPRVTLTVRAAIALNSRQLSSMAT